MSRMLVGIILMLIPISCKKKYIFEDYYHFSDKIWVADNPAVFRFSIINKSPYNLYVNIRHTNEYEKANLWLFINTMNKNRRIHRDTLECLLARPDGKWLGVGFGGTFERTYLFKSAYIFPNTGKFEIHIEQAMRADKIGGIRAVGFIVEQGK